MLAGPVILAGLGTYFGIFPEALERALVAPTVASLTGSVENAKELKLWAGVNLPLYLSGGTFVMGFLLYAFHVRLRAVLERSLGALPSLDRGWDRFPGMAERLGRGVDPEDPDRAAHRLSGGDLCHHRVALAAGMILRRLPPLAPAFQAFNWVHVALVLLILIGARRRP